MCFATGSKRKVVWLGLFLSSADRPPSCTRTLFFSIFSVAEGVLLLQQGEVALNLFLVTPSQTETESHHNGDERRCRKWAKMALAFILLFFKYLTALTVIT